MKSKIFIFICLLISLSACQIDKRVYRPGLSILSGEANKLPNKMKHNLNSGMTDRDSVVAFNTPANNSAVQMPTDSVYNLLPEETDICSSDNVFLPVPKTLSPQKSGFKQLTKHIVL